MIEPAPRSTTRYFCPACRRGMEQLLPTATHPAARCPECQSLERHRFLAVLIDLLRPWMRQRVRVVLDVAPTPIVRKLIHDRIDPWLYVATDLEPDRDIDVRADLTTLPLRDDSVDLLLCYHVLEHVPDDRAAMRELARVLSPAGLGIVQVPRHIEEVTDEGPLVPGETRAHRFGQDDHIRWYGMDFEQRLRDCGLVPMVLTTRSLFTEEEIDHLRLYRREEVWLVRDGGGTGRPGGGHHDLLHALLGAHVEARHVAADRERIRAERDHIRTDKDRIQAEKDRMRERHVEKAEELRRRLRSAERRAEDYEAAYERLSSHPVVRALRGIKAAGRRLRGVVRRERT